MKLSYGTLLSPVPIELSIGAAVRKFTLREIAQISFEVFSYYEALMMMTPENVYNDIMGESGKEKWNGMSDDERAAITLFDVIEHEPWLQESYTQAFNFFFDKPVRYIVEDGNGYFVFVKNEDMDVENIDVENDLYGAISRVSFVDVLDVIQQVCCLKDDEDETPRFKNEKARQIYEKMKKAQDEIKKQKKSDPNLTLPNLISAISNRHPTVNPFNVWDMTVFCLLDSFARLQVNAMFDINSTSVSVWGDEKKQFDPALWYKNEHENKGGNAYG